MLGTYASALVVLAAAAAVGQALFSLCGRTRWSWLAPAVGLAALMPIAWWSVRLPGGGTSALIVLGAVTLAAAARLHRQIELPPGAWRAAVPVALGALALASLPFWVEGRFGILGTGLNPDMSQHLFAADRLASGGSERLIEQGYPLGPHALAVGLTALGPSLVQAFGGLTVATAVIAALAPLGLLRRLSEPRRFLAALLVGLAYMTAAYLTQGAFKETMQALFLLAFAIGLGELARGRLAPPGPAQAVPLAVLAVGSIYAYSFPGLLWIGGAAVVWAAVELAVLARDRGADAAGRLVRRSLAPAGVALGAFAAAVAPEAGRLIEFAGFETFDPDGAGLGNLFNPLSPLEALGIWPSGDFRLEPGDGAVPAALFWLGAAVGLAALAFGLWWWRRRGERAVPVALVVAALLILAANVAGTPYQEAKAIALAAPLAMLISARALAEAAPTRRQVLRTLRRRGIASLFPRSARVPRLRLLLASLAIAFFAGAGLSSLLALANGPVGPARWSPALLELRPLPGPVLALAPDEFLDDQHGRDFLVWELRGGEVCVEAYRGTSGAEPPPGVAHVVVVGDSERPPVAGATARRDLGDYVFWEVPEPAPGASPCPFIADGARADPSAG
jgi:hypothetical protein